MTNTTFPFYTATAMQDANRSNTAFIRVCPRNRFLPFQIRRSHNTSVISDINIVDCSGNKTDVSAYFISTASVGTSGVGIISFTSYDYIQYNGGQFEYNNGTPKSDQLPYGVYYIEIKDSYNVFYSEHFIVKDILPNLITPTGWVENYDVFSVIGPRVAARTTTSVAKAASSNSIGGSLSTLSFKAGEKFNLRVSLALNSGEAPSVRINDDTASAISNTVLLAAGANNVVLTTTKDSELSTSNTFRIFNTTDTNWICQIFLRNTRGDFISLEFSNTDDLRQSEGNDILYATGGFAQRVYLETRMNTPSDEVSEIGEEINGLFSAEQINVTPKFSIVDYVSRSMYSGLQYLKMHDTITITDEVGNEYSPDVGNIDTAIDWDTFDTGTLRLTFNNGSMDWVNDQEAIT